MDIYHEESHDTGNGLFWTVEGPGCYHAVESLSEARKVASLLNTAYAMGHTDALIMACEK